MLPEDLVKLVRRYLRAEQQVRAPLCLHRYRGIVREREEARRWKEWSKLRTELEQAVAEPELGQLQPAKPRES